MTSKINVHGAFGRLSDDKEYTGVTLAFEDGHEMEAHKVIDSTIYLISRLS